jgi:hypothetical protein
MLIIYCDHITPSFALSVPFLPLSPLSLSSTPCPQILHMRENVILVCVTMAYLTYLGVASLYNLTISAFSLKYLEHLYLM